MNYFEESEHHFGHSSASTYIEFCRDNRDNIIKDIKAAQRHEVLSISNSILGDFERCYLVRKELFSHAGTYNQIFADSGLCRYLVQRDDFLLDVINICAPSPYHIIHGLAKKGDVDKINYFMGMVESSNIKTANSVAILVAKLGAEIYDKYISWVGVEDMRVWHANVLQMSLIENRKEEVAYYLTLLKYSELAYYPENSQVIQEIERRRIVAEQARLSSVVTGSNKGIVSKL